MPRCRSRTYTVVFLILGLGQACTRGTPEPVAMVKGTVVNTLGAAIEGATVTAGGRSTATGEDGTFELSLGGSQDDTIHLVAHAPQHASQHRLVEVGTTLTPTVTLRLRPVELLQTVALPGPGAKHDVELTRGDGQVVLSIPHGGLVGPDGSHATGEALVAMTYWHPVDDVPDAPADLLAAAPDGSLGPAGPTRLTTFGMVEIEVSQDGQLLQVAPDASLGLVIRSPADQRDEVAGVATQWPRLYWLNPATGYWQEEEGRYTYDAASGELRSQLAHLSLYNSDTPSDEMPGCMRGRVMSNCGAPVADAQVSGTLRGLDYAGNDRFRDSSRHHAFDVRTDAAGYYVLQVPYSGHNRVAITATANGQSVSLSLGAHQAVVSACSTDLGGACPAIPGCRCYADLVLTPPTATGCAVDCEGDTPCAIRREQAGQYTPRPCPACVELPDLVLSLGNPVQPGSLCGPGDVCCPDGNQVPHVCADQMCVPASE